MWTPHNLALKPSSKITFPPAEKVEAWMSNLDVILLKSLSTPILTDDIAYIHKQEPSREENEISKMVNTQWATTECTWEVTKQQ